MTVTIEISHYPLRNDYEDDIIFLINSFKENKKFTVITNAMSTQVKGEYDELIPHIFGSLKEIFSHGNMSSTILKIIPKDLPIEAQNLDI